MLFKMSNEGERKTQGKKKCAHKTHPHIFANVYSIKKRTKSKIPATTKTRATKNKQQINGRKKTTTTTESTNIYYEDNNIS